MPDNIIYFAHGKNSEPWGIKIKRLAPIAESKGFRVESPDYRGIADPQARLEKLIALQPTANQNLVLVGSSLGAYVSILASAQLKPQGLFLLATAVGLPSLEAAKLQPIATVCEAIHAWQDEIVPVDNMINFAASHELNLHLLKSDHSLVSALPEIEFLFAHFLDKVLESSQETDRFA